MKTVRVLLASLALLFVCGTAQAQFGKTLGKAIENAAKKTVERKAEQKTEEAVSKSIDKATDPNSYKDKDKNGDKGKTNSKTKKSSQDGDEDNEDEDESVAATPQKGVKAAEMAYAKSDFVPGDEIIFDDPMDNEQMGEFPSQWDLLDGNSEVAMANGKKGFELSSYNDQVTPLMKIPHNYLGDVFTVEFDFLSVKVQDGGGLWMSISLLGPDQPKRPSYPLMEFQKASGLSDGRYRYDWDASNGDRQGGDGEVEMAFDTWHHVAMSFNKRAWKLYINGVRIINVPNVKTPPGWLTVRMTNAGKGDVLFTNFRIAKGAVPLYDRLMSDGKIISYGITFDVGKATVKPESMSEINRIAKLMTDNPDLKFSVEGHTDNTGNVASNQKLSDERSAAVVAKLVEMGIAKDRLASAGKGQSSPIADNSTDEGRAKNRRVEFVKIAPAAANNSSGTKTAQSSGSLTLNALKQAAEKAGFVTDESMAYDMDFNDEKAIPKPVHGFCIEVTRAGGVKTFAIHVNEFASLADAGKYAAHGSGQDGIESYGLFNIQFVGSEAQKAKPKLMTAFTAAGWGKS